MPHRLSQETLIRIAETFEREFTISNGNAVRKELYRHNFPDWFITHLLSSYDCDWTRAVIALRTTEFFFPPYCDPSNNITGEYLSTGDAELLGEALLCKIAVLASSKDNNSYVSRSLELDGWGVNEKTGELYPLTGPINESEEESQLLSLLRSTGINDFEIIKKHIQDAHSLYAAGSDHPSLNESRSFLQAIIDAIGEQTHNSGHHKRGYPNGTANVLGYLLGVGFFNTDERDGVASAWAMLSSGSHPGIPDRAMARIGLMLSLEFGHILALKFASWKRGSFQSFN